MACKQRGYSSSEVSGWTNARDNCRATASRSPLTPKAFDTLVLLVENNGHAVEKDALMQRVWLDAFVEEATIAQNIRTLRKALGQSRSGGQFIETVPKYGYRFVAAVRHEFQDTGSASWIL